jgi:hypothetical protein
MATEWANERGYEEFIFVNEEQLHLKTQNRLETISLSAFPA